MSKRILVACEESQVVTKAFRDKGFQAFSADILDTSGANPEWHIKGDVLEILHEEWDAVIAFPPCQHLAVSGARYFKEKQADGRQQQGIDFFMEFTKLSHVPFTMIENPVGIMSTHYRKPDQIIQPWQFGEDASKKTCLWLNGLPLLEPTEIIIKDRYANQTASGQNNLAPSEDRAKLRAVTYQGIADAMATQWSKVING